MNIGILNGPNLNLLGIREPAVYGTTTLAEIEARLADVGRGLGVGIRCAQANGEGTLIDHLHDWWLGSKGEWTTMGVLSDGSYGVPAGLIFGFPCICEGGKWQIVKGLEIDAFTQEKINLTLKEIQEERDAVQPMLG